MSEQNELTIWASHCFSNGGFGGSELDLPEFGVSELADGVAWSDDDRLGGDL